MFYLLVLLTFFLSSCQQLAILPGGPVAIPQLEPKKSPPIVLVLGGGGSKGLSHLGAIQELEKAGIRPALIIGCSAGAIAGALYADQPDLEGTVATFIRLKKADVLDYSFFKPLFGFVDGNFLHKIMKKNLRAQTFEELKIPLIIVTTDLITGEIVELSSGDIARAVQASCAFPGMFKPVPLYGRYFIDGGASCPIPVCVAKKYGAKVIIAIDLSEKLSKIYPKHLFDVTMRSIDIAYKKLVEHSLMQADIVIKMDFDETGTFSDHLNEKLYQHGRQAVLNQLPSIKEKLMVLNKEE